MPGADGLLSTPIGADMFLPVCSPLYWRMVGSGAERPRLLHFDWYRTNRTGPRWDGLTLPDTIDAADVEHLYLSSEADAIAAALAGQGIALASSFLAADPLASGLLTRPFPVELPGALCDRDAAAAVRRRPALSRLDIG